VKKTIAILICVLLLLGGCAQKPAEPEPTSIPATPTLAPTPTLTPEPTPTPVPTPTAVPADFVELPELDLRFKLGMPLWEKTEQGGGVIFTWFPYDVESPMITFLPFPYEGDPDIMISERIRHLQKQFSEKDGAVWQENIDVINVGGGTGMARTMELEALRVRHIWFSTETTVYEITTVYMHEESADLMKLTMDSILSSIKTISGTPIASATASSPD